MEKNSHDQTSGTVNVKRTVISAVIGIIVTAVLMLVMSILLSIGKVPGGYSGIASSVMLLLGSIVAGILSSAKAISKKLICALCSGGVIFLTCILGGMMLMGENMISVRTVINMVTILVGVTCGSIVSTTGKGGRRRR